MYDTDLRVLADNLVDRLSSVADQDSLVRKTNLFSWSAPKFRLDGNTVSLAVNKNLQIVDINNPDRYLSPDEFEVSSTLGVDNSNNLEELFSEAYKDLIMVEENLWIDMVRRQRKSLEIAGPLTYKRFKRLQSSAPFKIHSALVPANISTNLVLDIDFTSRMKHVTSKDKLYGGELGSLDGINIYSDLYRLSNRRVLKDNEIILVAEPNEHGKYTNRGRYHYEIVSGWLYFTTTKILKIHNKLSMITNNQNQTAMIVTVK